MIKKKKTKMSVFYGTILERLSGNPNHRTSYSKYIDFVCVCVVCNSLKQIAVMSLEFIIKLVLLYDTNI